MCFEALASVRGKRVAVLKASNLDEAITLANGTQYALTGGFYSRSPANIERVTKEFLVGNLYRNPVITEDRDRGGFSITRRATRPRDFCRCRDRS